MPRPALPRTFRLAAAVALAAGVGACASGMNATEGPDAVPSAARLQATADSLAAAGSGAARQAVAVRALRRGGLTPLSDMGRRESQNPRFVLPSRRLSPAEASGEGTPVVAGLIPGRHPLARPDLIVVGARLDGPGAPAAIEAARVLVERSEWATVPERTVMVALWAGADGPARALRSGVWPSANVRGFVLTEPAAGLPDSLRTEVVPPQADGAAWAQAILDATVRLARRPAAADTLRPPSATIDLR